MKTKHSWDEASVQILRDMYPLAPRQDIMRHFPGVPWSAICKAAGSRGIKRLTCLPYDWTDERIEKLKAIYPTCPKDVILEELSGIKWQAIGFKARQLGVKRNTSVLLRGKPSKQLEEHRAKVRHWTKEQIEQLKLLYPSYPEKLITKAIKGKGWEAIQLKAGKLGIKRNFMVLVRRQSSDPLIQQLIDRRIDLKMPILKLSEKAKLADGLIGGYECGEASPTYVSLQKWVAGLGMKLVAVPIDPKENLREIGQQNAVWFRRKTRGKTRPVDEGDREESLSETDGVTAAE